MQGHIDETDLGKFGLEQVQQIDIHMIVFDTDASRSTHQFAHCVEIVVMAPVGVRDVLAERPAPGLTTVNTCTDTGGMLCSQ